MAAQEDDMEQDRATGEGMALPGPREYVVLEVEDPAGGEPVVFVGPDNADVERQAAEHFGTFPS